MPQTGGRKVLAAVVDVSVAGEVEEFCLSVFREMGRVDVLVNNAGVCVAGTLETVGIDDWRWVMGTNLWGVVHGCHFFYPGMIRQGWGGHIVNISSGAGLGPMPAMSAYGATKSAVLAMSRVLRAEAALHGIGVSAVCPGMVSTAIGSRTRVCSGTRGRSPEWMAGAATRLIALRRYPPRKVAEAVVRYVERNRAVLRVTPEAFLIDFLNRLSPRLYDLVLRYWLRAMWRWL